MGLLWILIFVAAFAGAAALMDWRSRRTHHVRSGRDLAKELPEAKTDLGGFNF